MTDGDSMPAPEFSRTIPVHDITAVPELTFEIEADEGERAALAARFGIVAIDRLTARLRARQGMTGDILVDGTLAAEVVQECVVTLEPVRERVVARFAQRFSYRPEAVDEESDEDPPEPVVGDAIEVGEVVAQNVSLALDPYPRADGVAFDEGGDADAPSGPFAALARLKTRDGQ